MIKRFILSTPLGKFSKETQGAIQKIRINLNQPGTGTNKTVYCISPYKTGTTFLASSFNESISQHEPLHFLTLKELEKDFKSFFVKRHNYLNLKLECSGFWSAYIHELASSEFSKGLDFIFILRPPSAWVTSVLNYWKRPIFYYHHFEFINELFWKRKVGVDLLKVDFSNQKAVESAATELVDFYFRITQESQLLEKVHYINLKDLESKLDAIGYMLGEKPSRDGSWKRKGEIKEFRYRNDEADDKYDLLVRDIIKTRKSERK